MLVFALSVFLVNMAVLATGAVCGWDLLGGQPATWVSLVGELLVVPTALALVGVEIVNRISPRRMFDPRVPATMAPIFAGIVTALIGTTLTAGVLPFNDQAHDVVVTGCASATASLVVCWIAPRRRNGICVRCGYDLSGSPSARCSECGAFHSA